MSEEDALQEKAREELAQKVIELTKALVFLYTRHDGHEARLTALKEFQEKEVQEISSWAAQRLREHQRLVAESCQRLGGRGEALRRSHAARLQEAQRGLQAARAVAPAPWGGQGRRVAELQGEAVELRRRLLAAEAQVGDDQQWLAKQVALEAWQRRGALERGFEEAQRAAKGQQLVRMEELRAAREARLLELRGHLEEERVRAQGQVEEALQEAVRRQELSFEVERRNLELVQERQAAALHEARVEVDAAKAQCQERQRLLDEMSRELQERKRHGQILSREADLCHQRKLRSEAGSRELRRKRMALERSYGLQACYEESASERAVQTQSLELQQGARQLEQLRAELVTKRRQLSERGSLVEERRLRGEQLSEDLAAERRCPSPPGAKPLRALSRPFGSVNH